MREHIIFDMHFLFPRITIEHIRNDIRQIRLRYHFLSVTQFNNALRYFFQIAI